MSYKLEKLSVPSMAAFGLGWYLSSDMTRDEKQSYGRHLENEWKEALRRQKQLDKKGRPISKSAMDALTEYWKNMPNVVFSDA